MDLEKGKRYRVHAGGKFDWKIRHEKTKYPYTTVKSVGIENAEFFIDEELRLRRIEEGQNTLHAWVYGDFAGEEPGWDFMEWEIVEYYPSVYDSFKTEDGVPVYKAERVMFWDNKLYVYKPE